MDPSPEGLKKYLVKNYPEGIYHLVYDVVFTGSGYNEDSKSSASIVSFFIILKWVRG
jgi:hypothetical protein